MAIVYLAGLVIILLASAIPILKEYEQAVVFRLGRVLGKPKGPGLILLRRVHQLV
jgi:regulator of protease activity HflC (stomatin/prohibitin superfamily)